MKRISGVSTVGNFVFVRGLSDRYLKTTLNGAEILHRPAPQHH